MKLTVVPKDKFMSKDDAGLFFDFAFAPGIHAIQWDTNHGHIERSGQPNELITDKADLASYVTAYDVEAARLDVVAAAELAFYNSPEQVALRQAEADRIAAKAQAFLDNLPSWAQVDQAVTNISNLADAKAFIRKLARLVYWLARDKAD